MSKKETIFLSFDEPTKIIQPKPTKEKRPRTKRKPINKLFFERK